MSVPGVSENKAIAVAKVFPTLDSLMKMLSATNESEKIKKAKLADVEMAGIGGEKSKKVGKAVADRIYMHFMAADPNLVVN